MTNKITKILFRVCLGLLYGLIGLVIAVPLSYFFQSSALQVMSLQDYVMHFKQVMFESARLGAFDVFRICAVSTVIGVIIIGNLIEKYFKR